MGNMYLVDFYDSKLKVIFRGNISFLKIIKMNYKYLLYQSLFFKKKGHFKSNSTFIELEKFIFKKFAKLPV